MKLHSDVTQAIELAPDGPKVAAFFDFDGTVIAGFSVKVFLKEQLRRGQLSPQAFTELTSALLSFSIGKLGFSGLMTASAAILRGVSEESYCDFGEELYQKHIARMIYPESRALIDAHLAKGHTIALVSSATRYQVEPAAKDLGFEHILYSKLEVEDGLFTGKAILPACHGVGKVTAAETLAAEKGLDLDQSFFYSDGEEDVPLLERVGNPQPLNPTPKLVAIAERRGWPIRRFRSRGRPRVTDALRSVAATASMVPSFTAGLPVWALTGSRREGINFSTSLFADTASALIGLNLDVDGEHHLWEKRPAVFIFNHQSQADGVIIPKLLRRDIASVGKKELANMPLIGRVMQLGGTVLIDRENSGSAIEAMQPLVDAMMIEGKSVALAPEGTRTISPKLGPFKKGAFHLAIQAGVPIVPIVIHNSGDVQPKGDWVYRPATVKVDVLAPIDTSTWTAENINTHVAEVRQLFLDTLGQAEDQGENV